MKHHQTDFVFWMCAMGAALFIACAVASKARELDNLNSAIAILEAELNGLRRDVEELQAHCIEAKETAELEGVK